MSKTNFFQIILLVNLFFHTFGENIYYNDENIKDMESSFFKKIDIGFHHLNDNILPANRKIVAFTDMDEDGYTDLITYQQAENKFIFYHSNYDKENKKFKGEIFLFNITDEADIGTIRNVHVGSFYKNSKICFLVSFNKNDSNTNELIHYIRCDSEVPQRMNIKSNILIMNKDDKENGQILYHDGTTRVICTLKNENHTCGGENDKKFEKSLNQSFDGCLKDKNNNDKLISTKGGLAYIDLNGNCAPDLVISYEDEDDQRHIEIYRSLRHEKNQFCLMHDLKIGNKDQYGAFTISRMKNEKSQENIPNFDILIPKLDTNQIIAYKNKVKKGYDWSDYYCEENDEKMGENNKIFSEGEGDKFILNLTKIDETKEFQFDLDYVTIIRPGDFLGNENPGILVKYLVGNEKEPVIALYSKEGDEFQLALNITGEKIAKPKRAFFFDINESGTLSIIVETEDGKNHIFFNYRSSFFIKSKLMNDKGLYSDINLGSISRYIVTDQDGDRHMEISYQLPQTSDMSMPLPYSLSFLGETNNYVENFQIMSGNYLKDVKFASEDHKNFMSYTPIIPNTQMKIFKYKNSDSKYEWLIELIIQPMDQVVILVIVMIVVMLALLGVIIYLHIREVKEEQKETNKFKSWFA